MNKIIKPYRAYLILYRKDLYLIEAINKTMAEENSNNKIKDTIDAVTGLTKNIPIYPDAIQPAAKEVGKSLETVAKTVNVALLPLKAMVWSFDKLQGFIDTIVSDKLKNTPANEIQTPKANIVVPALQALSYTGDEPELQELFANLIASSMDKHTSDFVHPSFVEQIKQLTPDEAKLLKYFSVTTNLPTITIRSELKEGKGGWDVYRHVSLFGEKSGCENPHLTSVALDNLIRLGLIEIPHTYSYTDKMIYEELKNDSNVKSACEQIDKEEGRKCKIVEEMISITDFGNQFINICVTDHKEHRK